MLLPNNNALTMCEQLSSNARFIKSNQRLVVRQNSKGTVEGSETPNIFKDICEHSKVEIATENKRKRYAYLRWQSLLIHDERWRDWITIG
jgi:hypothetical protein